MVAGALWLSLSLRFKKHVDGQLIELRAAKSTIATGSGIVLVTVVYIFAATLLVRLVGK